MVFNLNWPTYSIYNAKSYIVKETKYNKLFTYYGYDT